MAKYLILDKSILHGASTERLCRFVKAHNVILPESLFYECLTTEEQERQRMIGRCRNALLAGAFVCPTISAVVHSEAKELRPFGSLVDPECNTGVRETFLKATGPYEVTGVQERFQNEQAFVDQVETNISRITDYLKADVPEALQKDIERWGDIDRSRPDRLRGQAQLLDTKDLHEAANTLLEGVTLCPEKFCLSEDWISWHFVRVVLIWLSERGFCHQARGRMKRGDLEHDTCDVEYVTFLSRADGLLMRDLLWQNIAKAAFPEKDVFSSLEEVPESYRCDWAEA